MMVFIALNITGLDNIWHVKPLVNGNAIMQITELKGGYHIREWVKNLCFNY